MLAEGFLRLLRYREERKFATASKRKRHQTSAHCADPLDCTLPDSRSANQQINSAEEGPNQEVQDPSQVQGLRLGPQAPGLLIPRCSPVAVLLPVCIEDCSLLEQYPDLQVADSGRIAHNPLRATVSPPGFPIQPPAAEVRHRPDAFKELPTDAVSSCPDQGYLVMGASENISLDLPGSQLEPMSNSVLNGLLEKQLEEVYMQHLTDNLARCNSHLENSLLHGLVPPPQGPNSLEGSLEEEPGGDSSNKISYLSTHNLVPCSSNFSSPVLRISEPDGPHLQGNILPK
ncbi:uncharacterized protein PAE49_014554 [Odontesthes bonariensis]|uniref:uncharacterized protein LOC142397213 n=1 Tax=Odontesthes bonariensis TaxID=219752 RepID=UPI003F58A91D